MKLKKVDIFSDQIMKDFRIPNRYILKIQFQSLKIYDEI